MSQKKKGKELGWYEARERHFKRCKDEFYKTEVIVNIYSKIEPSDNYLPGKEFVNIVKGLYPMEHPERKVEAFVGMSSMPVEPIDCRTYCGEMEDHNSALNSSDEMDLIDCMEGEGLLNEDLTHKKRKKHVKRK